MLLTIPKKKSAAEPPAELLSEFAQLIDQYGALSEAAEPILKKIAALQEELKPLAQAKKDVEDAVAKLEIADDATGEEIGALFKVEFGKRGASRQIKDMEKVVELMGAELFLKVATVTLKNIDDYLTPPQKELVLETSRTKRTVKLVKRAKAK